MPKIHEIPIVAVNGRASEILPDIPANSVALALLGEIEAKLEALAKDGEESSLDLCWLRGMPADLALLRDTLGQGEVSATISTIGSSQVQETAVPCVWWISHHDHDGSRLGEFIEIAECPDLLRSDRLSIPQGLANLRVRCAQLPKPHPSSSQSSSPEGN